MRRSSGNHSRRVTDPSGASVAGANIEVLNIDTNVPTRTTSNEAGNYQAPFLLPGITRAPGPCRIQEGERQGIRVSTGAQITLDFVLELGATSETVTVTAAAPLLNTAAPIWGKSSTHPIWAASR